MPKVFDYIEDRQFDTARKVVLKNFGDAVRMVALHSDIRAASNAEDFVENYLSKEFKILKTCKNDNLRDCGIETGENKIFNVAGVRTTMPKTINELAPKISSGSYIDPLSESYGFIMSNGYSVNLFYNNSCIGNNKTSTMAFQDRMCINAIYDINGLASPNQVGKDIGFVTVLYPGLEMSVVSPNAAKGSSGYANYYTAPSICAGLGKDFRAPSRDELGAMYFNSYLLNLTLEYVSSTSFNNEITWVLQAHSGYIVQYQKNRNSFLWCVK